MGGLVEWLAPIVVSFAAGIVDNWAEGAAYAGGAAGTIALVWLALRMKKKPAVNSSAASLTLERIPPEVLESLRSVEKPTFTQPNKTDAELDEIRSKADA